MYGKEGTEVSTPKSEKRRKLILYIWILHLDIKFWTTTYNIITFGCAIGLKCTYFELFFIAMKFISFASKK